jgi:hypothetical protein
MAVYKCTKYIFIYLSSYFFFRCLRIETVKVSEKSNNASAVLKVDKIIHWEDFDTLYVNISVDDRNTDPKYQQNRFASGK